MTHVGPTHQAKDNLIARRSSYSVQDHWFYVSRLVTCITTVCRSGQRLNSSVSVSNENVIVTWRLDSEKDTSVRQPNIGSTKCDEERDLWCNAMLNKDYAGLTQFDRWRQLFVTKLDRARRTPIVWHTEVVRAIRMRRWDNNFYRHSQPDLNTAIDILLASRHIFNQIRSAACSCGCMLYCHLDWQLELLWQWQVGYVRSAIIS